MGDFNCLPDDGSWRPFENRWIDSCRAVSTETSREAENAGTLVEKRMRIDYIRVDPRAYRVLDAGLVPTGHRRVSDHIGYFADIWRVSANGSG
jgi:endonuclease/exonuclease/phosphatase family metal-dependent hydrolase